MNALVEIQGEKYNYKIGYRDDELLRRSFNELAEKTFGINFEEWYQAGFWGDGYIPYSLIDKDKVVANVSVSTMSVVVNGEDKELVQIGTVMTDENYRNKGLSRFLMEKVLKEWEDKCDFIFLFGNDSVLNFYPKFGFKIYDEYQCSTNSVKGNNEIIVRKLNLEDEEDKEIFTNIIKNTVSFSKLYEKDKFNLIMFYCMDFLKNSIYYIKDLNVITICDYSGDEVLIQDVFALEEIALEKVISALMNERTRKVVLGFTPKDTSSYKESILHEEDTTLFIRSKKETPFDRERIMFPMLSHT